MNRKKEFNEYIKRYYHIQKFSKSELGELRKGFFKKGRGFCLKCWRNVPKIRILRGFTEEGINVVFKRFWMCKKCGSLSHTL